MNTCISVGAGFFFWRAMDFVDSVLFFQDG